MKNSSNISLELGKRFPLRKIFAQILTILILWQTIIPATFALNSGNSHGFLSAKNLLASSDSDSSGSTSGKKEQSNQSKEKTDDKGKVTVLKKTGIKKLDKKNTTDKKLNQPPNDNYSDNYINNYTNHLTTNHNNSQAGISNLVTNHNNANRLNTIGNINNTINNNIIANNTSTNRNNGNNFIAPTVQNIGEVAIVRHGPSLNGGRAEGTIRVLLGESTNINSGMVITGDLLVPGTPTVNVNASGNTNYNGTIEGTGSSTPSNYTINLNNGISLRHVVTHTNPVTMPVFAPPTNPTGTRNVTLSKGDSPGDFSTIRNLTLHPNYAALLTVPPGAYGQFIASNNTGFIFGVIGQNTIYNLQDLVLNSSTQLQILGNVTINLKNQINLNSQSIVGNPASPISLSLSISTGGINLNSQSNLYAVVTAPNGTVNINANSLLQGFVICDRLHINANGLLKGLAADVTAPQVTIIQPSNGATLTQAQITVTGTFNDESVVTLVKVNGVTATIKGNTFTATIPLTVGNNTITAIATDIFGNSGQASITVTRSDGTNQVPTVNAGADQTITLPSTTASLIATASDDGLPSPPAQLTYSWTKVSGTGTVTFSSSTSLTTTATFSSAGTYVLRISASDSLLSASDDIVITVNPTTPQNQAPTVNAGNDQTITLPSTASLTATANDDGLPSPPAQLTYSWTKISGSGTVTFNNSTSLSTTATFSDTGTYTLRFTVNDSVLSASDDVVITVSPSTSQNLAPVVNAGADQSITLPSNVTLQGSITDDGLPTGSSLSVTWSKISGSGTVTFTSQNTAITQASFSSAGTYILRLSANDTELTGTDDIVITVNGAQNSAPTVNAGANQTITLPSTASLVGTATDDGLPSPPAQLTTTWSKVNGPGTVTFSAANQLTTNATFSLAGVYLLRLIASDSELSANDDIEITVNPAPAQNIAPVVSAGADQTITLPSTASLVGTATDDSLPNPPAQLTTTWSKVSGSGTVTFSTPSQLTTSATFSVADTYVLRLTASDSALSTIDDIQVIVNPAPPQNQIPNVSAGADQTITLPSTANLVGTATDDGLPSPPAQLTVTWSKVNGPGTVTFSNPNSLTTSATFSIAGSYTLQLTAGDSALSSTDDVTITVNSATNQAPVVSAGQNQNILVPYGPNLIRNPGNEGQIVNNVPSDWAVTFAPTNWTKPTTPTPVEGNSSFLNTGGMIFQDIDVSIYSQSINAGTQKFAFNGYIRGNGSGTTARIIVSYFGSSGSAITGYTTPTVGPSDWTLFSDVRTAPVGTVTIKVQIQSTNAFVDALSFRALLGSHTVLTTNLAGTVTDDGLPSPPTQTTSLWSVAPGSRSVSFATPTQLNTVVTFSDLGTYTLRLTVSDGELQSFSDVTITIKNIDNVNNVAVNAGADQTLVVPYGPNLIRNPGNEGQIVNNVPSDWAVTFAPTNWTKPTTPTPVEGNSSFLNTGGMIFQDIDVSIYSQSINAGTQKFAFNGYIRGNGSGTTARIIVSYFGSSGSAITGYTTPTVGPSDWTLFSDVRTAPVGTVTIKVQIQSTNAFVDALSFRALLGTANLPSASLTGTVLENTNPVDDRLYIQWTKISGPGLVTFSTPNKVTSTATVTDVGTYVLRLTANDLGFSLSDDLTITFKNIADTNNVTVDAGQDQTLVVPYGPNLIRNPGNEGQIVSNLPSSWTYLSGQLNWTKATTPTPVEGNSSFLNTTGSIFQDIDVSIHSQAIALGTQKFAFNFYARSNGSSTSARVTLRYRNSSGSQLAVYDTAGLLGSGLSDWTLFTDIRTAPIGTASIRIELTSINYFVDAFSLRALLDTTSLPSINLTGTVLENANPVDNRLYIQWTKVSGPGLVTFSTPNKVTSTATFTDTGTHVLRLTASDLGFSLSDDIVFNLNETQGQNQVPLVSAGEDQTIPSNTTTLSATITDDGLPNPPAQVTVSWTKVNGTGTVTFSNPSSATTNVTFSQPGIYTLRITVSDSQLTNTDDIVISYITNFAPIVNAGQDQTVNFSSILALSGSYTDDGRPVGATYSFSWFRQNPNGAGPGFVTFSNPNSLTTTATFSNPGVYTLVLSVSDGLLVGQDTVVITVLPDNQPPLVSAGSNQQITSLSTTLSGTVIDDALPTGSTVTQSWSQVSGSGSVSFASPTSTTTLVTFPSLGTYVLRLTASDTVLTFTSDITIEVLSATYSDLAITQINTPSIVVDGQSLAITGQVSANISNLGNLATSSFTVTFFEDLNNNRSFDLTDNILATSTNQGLAANASATMSANISGTVQFSNSLIFAFIDSGQSITESNENNNYFNTEPACEYVPLTSLYPPSLKFGWNINNSTPVSKAVLMAPVVADLNADSYPDIIFAYTIPGPHGVITAISGKDGSQLFEITNSNHLIVWGSQITVADIDLDGRPEILATHTSHTRIMAFEHDGTFKWFSSLLATSTGTSISIADIDSDGRPEIIVGRQVFNNDGTTRWVGGSQNISAARFSPVADLDLDGIPEILNGKTTYRANGTILWERPDIGNIGEYAIGDFDSDPFPELVAVVQISIFAYVYLLEHNGDIKWRSINGDFAGSPTIADFDGDGEPEIGISGRGTYTVFETDGSIKWSIPITDGSSGITSSTSFDFDGDGKVEILYCDEQNLKIINGIDGAILYELPLGSTTLSEHPVVADVDNDGSADLIVPVDAGNPTYPRGLYVFHNPGKWVAARKIFNQHTYHITNINEDSTIPRKEEPSWLKYNGYRYQKFTGQGCEYSKADLAASYVRKSTVGTNIEVTVRIGNGGRLLAKAGIKVALYNGNPTSGGVKLTTLTTLTDILPNRFLDIIATLSGNVTANTLWILVDETNLVVENDETNNSYNSGLLIGIQNLAPVVNAGQDQTITSLTTNLSATVSDDGLPSNTLSINWGKVSGPGTVTFASPTQAATGVTFSQGGTYLLRISAFDGELTTSDEIQVFVLVNTAPIVNAGIDQTVTSLTTTLSGSVTDDGLPAPPALQPTWSKVSGTGTVTFTSVNTLQTDVTFSGPGTYVLRLSVNDSELTGTDDIQIVVNGNFPAPPTVIIHSPLDGTTITNLTNIVATISNGDWVLEYSLNADDDLDPTRTYTTIATGNTTVTNSTIATLDPTLMLNGNYLIRLRVTDSFGQIVTFPISTVLDKNLKVGNFTLSFTDAAVPVAGIPITVIRTYDSRDKRKGDFGVGWTLDIKNIRLEKSSNLGKHWLETIDQEGFVFRYRVLSTRAKLVTITFPDGRVFKFKAKPSPETQINVPVTELNEIGMLFVPEPGTQGTLVAIDDQGQDLEVQGIIPNTDQVPGAGVVQIINKVGATPGLPYNPTRFKLTTLEGAEFIIDEINGLQSIKDLNDNTLTVNNNGIVHSSGKSVAFTRDSQGRITQLTDPNNNVTTYTYNAAGDLVSVLDPANNTTSFTYNSNHYLLDITDPRGIKPIRNEYDSSGRLIKHTDAFNKDIIYTHQVAAKIETITDRLGNPTVFEYDDNGNVLKKTDALGHITTYTYDNFDNQLTETNAIGKTTTSTYDGLDNLLTQTDPLGNTTTYTYSGRRQVLTITDPKGNVTTNTYDPKGNLLTTRDALNHTSTYTYNPFGLVLTQTDAQNNVTTYQYSGSQPSQITDAQGHITSFTYDQNGNQLTSTTTRTVNSIVEVLTTTNTYDNLNRLTTVTYPDNSSTSTTYNAIGKVATSTDQLGRVTSYNYDSMGQLTSTTFADLTTASSTYDAEGRRLTSTDQLGRTTSFQYDQLGRLTKTTAPDSSFTTTVYDAISRVTSTTDQLGHTTLYEYDANCGCSGRRSKITDALGNFTTFAYDQNGNQISFTDARGNTTINTYDVLNRQTRVTFPDSTFQQTSYDSLGRRVASIDQAGKLAQYFYDSLGRLTRVKDALNHETQYGYDELGQQITQTDAKNRTTSYLYDKLGRRTKRSLPMGQFETYSYDLAGRLTSHRDFTNNLTTFTYDQLNRLLSKIPDASFNQSPITFTYNNLGQRVTMVAANGTSTYGYDNRNRLTSKTTPKGTLTYGYNTVGNITTIRSTNSNGVTMDYAYDNLNRLQSAQDNNLTTGQNQTAYNYDQVGNLQTVTLPNQVTTSYQYNNLNRLTNVSTSKTATTISSYAYSLGAAGNRLSVSELSGRVVNYTYDSIYRLTNETISGVTNPTQNGSIDYDYDEVGNRLSRTSTLAAVASQANITVDNNDRLTSDSYDDNGSTIGADGRSYTYDFEHRVIGVTAPGLIISIVYDGDGNRVSKTVNGVTTDYLVDTNNLTGYAQVVEEIQNGVVIKQYSYGLDLISQRQLIGNDRVTSFYVKDGHGSVRSLTDSSGVLTDSYDYDSHGILINQTGNTPNNYRYAGEQFDFDLGLYYNRARYLDVNRGRFWSQDKSEGVNEEPKSLHKYLYASADPVNNIDPSGNDTLPQRLPALGLGAILSALPTLGIFAAKLAIACVLTIGITSVIQDSFELDGASGPCFAPPRSREKKYRAIHNSSNLAIGLIQTFNIILPSFVSDDDRIPLKRAIAGLTFIEGPYEDPSRRLDYARIRGSLETRKDFGIDFADAYVEFDIRPFEYASRGGSYSYVVGPIFLRGRRPVFRQRPDFTPGGKVILGR